MLKKEIKQSASQRNKYREKLTFINVITVLINPLKLN